MFEETLKSIRATLYERTASPLSGTFIVSWLLWNWRFIYILLPIGNESGQQRLEYLKSNWSPDGSVLVIYPIISTIALISIYPFAAWVAFKVYLWHQKRLRQLKWESEKDQYISREKAAELRLQFRTLEKQSEEAEERNISKIQELEDQLKQLTSTKKIPPESTPIASSNSVSPANEVEKMIERLTKRGMLDEFKILGKKILLGRVFVSSDDSSALQHLDAFCALNLIVRTNVSDSRIGTWGFTELGKQVYRELV